MINWRGPRKSAVVRGSLGNAAPPRPLLWRTTSNLLMQLIALALLCVGGCLEVERNLAVA